MVATPVLPLIQVPPDGDELNMAEEPTHKNVVPDIAVGVVLIVTICVTKQPPPTVYVISVVPLLMPDTTPVPDPTVAILKFPLVQVPPPGEEVNVVIEPAHKTAAPVIAAGVVLTVICLVAIQLPSV